MLKREIEGGKCREPEDAGVWGIPKTRVLIDIIAFLVFVRRI
jgi:hypothetical protein